MTDHIHDENCAHDEEDEIIEIEDENGVVKEMIIAVSFEVKDKSYAVLIDRNDPESEAMIFRLDEQGEDLFLNDIEDDQEWQEVLNVYESLLNEQG